MVELIITEKPAAAQKIAVALADGKPVQEKYKGVSYYSLTHNKKDILVGCAVGHLFGLEEKEKKKGFAYPTFDIEWKPTFETNKSAAFSKKYFETLQYIAKKATTFTVACDYDIEGEVIGLNIVRFICKQKDAKRMKFSTLTKPDLVTAYETVSPGIDWGQAEAGETRHYLDYFYGINISRALTSAIKKAGTFKILSTGRVQGPTLKIIVDREKEIKAFKPVPFWQLELTAQTGKQVIIALHEKDKFWNKQEVQTIYSQIKDEKKTSVVELAKNSFKQLPPTPFDLTSLQTEAYRCFGIKPDRTLAIAQDLYTAGNISYPRTSSQQLPSAIGFASILKQLIKNKNYSELAKELLKKKTLEPANGKKTDPAHPAIYPTGIQPKALEAQKAKIYDIIVKRFLATFAEAATRETVTITLAVKTERFIAKGSRTTSAGWHTFYAPYVKLEEVELPQLKEKQELLIKKIDLQEKQTQPPKRYTPSSIIKELEKRALGTKATRAAIIETLIQRNYITGEAFEATELGIRIIDILEKYSPKIIDEELTRHFELDMDAIREGKRHREEILREAKNVITEILHEFKHKEKEVGEGLKITFQETKIALTSIGQCMICKKGLLVLRRGRFGMFAACDKYPECKTTFKMPQALIQPTDKVCEQCQYPKVTVIKKAKRPQELCINPDCPSKKIDTTNEGKPCQKCGKGKLVLRKGVYGSFLACSEFPKCRNIQK